MAFPEDPRLLEAQAIPIVDIVQKLAIGNLRRAGAEMIGPCPNCGGRDRFGVNLQLGKFLCRKCDGRGDGISLVSFVMGCDFKAALAWLCGEQNLELDPAEAERRQRLAAEKKRKQDGYAAASRRRAREDALGIWHTAGAAAGTIVHGYLERRGITPSMLPNLPIVLRFSAALPYAKSVLGRYQTIHRGPAMVAIVHGPDNRGRAVHRTWIDLDQDDGKAVIQFEGETFKSKTTRGSKKGGSIRLFTPQNPNTLVMGEGIETTLSALVANAVPGAAYWAGVDLGNMSGRRKRVAGTRYSNLPDMQDTDAFVPPQWVKRLIFIQDGDSHAKATRAKLEAGLRRAMALRLGLVGQIVHAGAGVDLNDVLRGEALANDR